MTAAICLKCGAMKVGAFTRCPKCRFTPESGEDQARSILLSDRTLDLAALKDTAQRIAGGETPVFDEAAVVQMAAEFGELRKHVSAASLGLPDFSVDLDSSRRFAGCSGRLSILVVRHGR